MEWCVLLTCLLLAVAVGKHESHDSSDQEVQQCVCVCVRVLRVLRGSVGRARLPSTQEVMGSIPT